MSQAFESPNAAPWRGAEWVKSRLAAAGFETPRIATQVYVSEAVTHGLLESAEAYEIFCSEYSDEGVRNALDGGRSGYRSPHIEALAAGLDRSTFAKLNPGLTGDLLSALPTDALEAYRKRLRAIVQEQKAAEIAAGRYELSAGLVDKGPAASFKALAKTLPLRFAKGTELGLPVDGPCLVSETSGPLRPILFFEPGRRMARVDLSASPLLLRGSSIVSGFDMRQIVPNLHWYSRIGSSEEAALGLAAYARFVVELAAALNDGEGTMETP
ncbi:MAG: hypothetical protein K9G59_10375 [Caulobacter sp.]|nr:hypothetical protein [Caulobacter sp.]